MKNVQCVFAQIQLFYNCFSSAVGSHHWYSVHGQGPQILYIWFAFFLLYFKYLWGKWTHDIGDKTIFNTLQMHNMFEGSWGRKGGRERGFDFSLLITPTSYWLVPSSIPICNTFKYTIIHTNFRVIWISTLNIIYSVTIIISCFCSLSLSLSTQWMSFSLLLALCRCN